MAPHQPTQYRHPFSERVAWTWEIQLHQDHNLFDHFKAMCVSRDVAEVLRIAVLDLTEEDKAKPWDELFDDRDRFFPVNTPDENASHPVCTKAEEVIASWL